MITDGRASRMFSNGTRLCPPASSFPSVPWACSRATVSSTDSGAAYRNGAGFMFRLPLSLGEKARVRGWVPRSGFSNDLQQPVRAERHLRDADPELRQRIV